MKGLVMSGSYTVDVDSGFKAGIYRIVIPDRDNLLVAFANERMHASRGTDISKDTVVGEVEIPDELVLKIERYLDAEAALNAAEPAFREFLPATRAPKFKKGDRVRIVRLEEKIFGRPHGEGLSVGVVTEGCRVWEDEIELVEPAMQGGEK